MKKTASKVQILLNCFCGYFFKYCVDLGILSIPKLNNCSSNNIVVSLTSYGRRVRNCIVYYTVVSLLRQKKQPKRIILWLSETEWNDKTLPLKLSKLRSKGVEIFYCKDIRSYKKLIPTLDICLSDNILTVDDDIIYSSDMVQTIIEENILYPQDILCFNALVPKVVDGIPQKYTEWQSVRIKAADKLFFPIGAGGILYPIGSLHPEVSCNNLFEKLCPMADDIWFWFNGLQNKTSKRFILKKGKDYSFDALYQYFHKGSALTHMNRMEHQNDKQFIQLFNYYNLTLSDQGELHYK